MAVVRKSNIAVCVLVILVIETFISCQSWTWKGHLVSSVRRYYVYSLRKLTINKSIEYAKCKQIYYFDELLYLGSLTMIRLSILCLYLRIFPQRWFKLSIYAMMATNTIYGAAFVLLSIFQCKPVQAAWTRWDGTVSANCVNVNALAWTSAAVNIVLDVITVILPLPALTRLAMSQKRKTHMFGIFSLGVL